jgi:hypothetical protein
MPGLPLRLPTPLESSSIRFLPYMPNAPLTLLETKRVHHIPNVYGAAVHGMARERPRLLCGARVTTLRAPERRVVRFGG